MTADDDRMTDDGLPPRLMAERTEEGRAIRRYLRHPHSASEERVWQRLTDARRAALTPRRAWVPAAWATAGAALGVVALALLWRSDRVIPHVPQEPTAVSAGQSIVLGSTATALATGHWT